MTKRDSRIMSRVETRRGFIPLDDCKFSLLSPLGSLTDSPVEYLVLAKQPEANREHYAPLRESYLPPECKPHSPSLLILKLTFIYLYSTTRLVSIREDDHCRRFPTWLRSPTALHHSSTTTTSGPAIAFATRSTPLFSRQQHVVLFALHTISVSSFFQTINLFSVLFVFLWDVLVAFCYLF